MLFAPNPTVTHPPMTLPVSVDKVSFQQFVKAQETAVYTFCFRLLGNPHLAEKAAQGAFLDVCSYFPAVSLVDVLIAARRRCRQQWGRGNGCDDMTTTDDQYLFEGFTLPEREVLALYYGCPLRLDEMATILNCSTRAVRAVLTQARHHAVDVMHHQPDNP